MWYHSHKYRLLPQKIIHRIVSIVQVPNTLFENNEIVIDDLAKMMFPPFQKTPENVAQNNTFQNQ